MSTTLIIGNASGAPGDTVNVDFTLNPILDSIASMQFDLVFSALVESGIIIPGIILTTASKTLAVNPVGKILRVIIFGLNQTAIAAGLLMTAQFKINPSAFPGPLAVSITNVVYSDPSGVSIAPGPTTDGIITVTSPTPISTVPSFSKLGYTFAQRNAGTQEVAINWIGADTKARSQIVKVPIYS